MYKVTIKISANEKILETTLKALTKKGIERKTKNFIKNTIYS